MVPLVARAARLVEEAHEAARLLRGHVAAELGVLRDGVLGVDDAIAAVDAPAEGVEARDGDGEERRAWGGSGRRD